MASGVEFEEDRRSYGPRPQAQNPAAPAQYSYPPGMMPAADNEPAMVRWLMRHGLAKSPNSAQYVLVAVVLANIIITFIIIKYFL